MTLSSEDDFTTFAGVFARRLRPGDVVAISGPLGSGKTTFVRAIVRSLQGADKSYSPTFTFWHHHGGDPPIEHIDLFRLETPSDSSELGLEEAFDGRSIVFVEWWSNAPAIIPSRRYEVEIEGAGSEPRYIFLRGPT